MYQYRAASLMLAVTTFITSTTARPSQSRRIIPDPSDIDNLFSPAMSCTSGNCSTVYIQPCQTLNNTQYLSVTGEIWTMLCDIDFFQQDIYPFLKAISFYECVEHCNKTNIISPGTCAGLVFAPERIDDADNCYLKSSVQHAVNPATIQLVGATIVASPSASTTIMPIPASVTLTESTGIAPSLPSQLPPTQRQGRKPFVAGSSYLGVSTNKLADQYVEHTLAVPIKLSTGDLLPGTNAGLINDYPLASDTGTWTGRTVREGAVLANMTVAPRIARDGGRGANINGTNIFIFCDTSTYGQQRDPVLGYLNGFVSSSVAIDDDMRGLQGEPLLLTNPLGQWQDDVGRMRGWAPMTTGEEAFNIAVSGQGYRYAVWPNASPIPLNSSHAVMYAPLVYLEVDMEDQSSPRYTSLGNTLLSVYIDPVYGPHADRLENMFFTATEINWGSLGGIRAWSRHGTSDSSGFIYLFGQADAGVMLARVVANDFTNKSAYQYWTGDSWSMQMPPSDSNSEAVMIAQQVMNMDVFYSPLHKTFIMIYLTPEADNTFYYRHLMAEDGSSLFISAAYETGGDADYVEQLLQHRWSDQQILFTVPKPVRGYMYAGGMHAGYFGREDITTGGSKMLVTWTEHTLVDPNVPESGYAHKSQVIDFGAG